MYTNDLLCDFTMLSIVVPLYMCRSWHRRTSPAFHTPHAFPTPHADGGVEAREEHVSVEVAHVRVRDLRGLAVALLVAPASLVLPPRPFACRIERYLSELLARSWYSWSGASLILNHSSGGLADFRWSYSSPSDGLSGPENAVRGVNVWSSRLTHVYFDCLAATATPTRPRPLPLAGAAAAAGAGTPWPLPLPRPLPPPLVAGAGAGATVECSEPAELSDAEPTSDSASLSSARFTYPASSSASGATAGTPATPDEVPRPLPLSVVPLPTCGTRKPNIGFSVFEEDRLTSGLASCKSIFEHPQLFPTIRGHG